MHTNQSSNYSDPQLQAVVSKQEKMQQRFLHLKDNAKTMFQQTESDYDLLTDRIYRLETDFKFWSKLLFFDP